MLSGYKYECMYKGEIILILWLMGNWKIWHLIDHTKCALFFWWIFFFDKYFISFVFYIRGQIENLTINYSCMTHMCVGSLQYIYLQM